MPAFLMLRQKFFLNPSLVELHFCIQMNWFLGIPLQNFKKVFPEGRPHLP